MKREGVISEALAIFVKSLGYCPIDVLALLAVIFDAKADQDGPQRTAPAGRRGGREIRPLRLAKGGLSRITPRDIGRLGES